MARDGLGSSETGLNPAPMESDLCDIRSPARDCDVPARGSGRGQWAGVGDAGQAFAPES